MESVQLQYESQCNSQSWILERYNLYKSMLYRIAFSYLGNRHDSEDILQEAFIRLCYLAPDFPTGEDEKRWIIRVTINLCKKHLRSFWYRNRRDLKELEEYAAEQTELTILEEIINLPQKYKIVIYLHYYEGYRIAEIAEILKLSVSAVKMRLMRGREMLRLELEENSV